MNETSYVFSGRARKAGIILTVIGALFTILGFLFADSTRVWANLLLNGYYFMGLSLIAIFFLAVHVIGYGGWYVVVQRVAEAISSYLLIPVIVLVLVVAGTYTHLHHIYHWADDFIVKEEVTVGELREYEAKLLTHATHESENAETSHDSHGASSGHSDDQEAHPAGAHQKTFASLYENEPADKVIPNPHYDAVIAGKMPFFKPSFYIPVILVFFILWLFFGYRFRQLSTKEDETGSLEIYERSKVVAAAFLVVFAVSTSVISWQLIMSIDTHWYSTLFGWYNFASYFVAGIALLILFVIYLKAGRGLLPQVNESHLHDLGKFLFAFSIFWTYLWFSQYMLQWYGNIPEETVYFKTRFDDKSVKFLFFLNIILNFFVPFLALMTRSAKRNMEVLGIVSVVILFGHWLDFWLMIMPGAVGAENAKIGWVELFMPLLFIGLFIIVVLNTLSKKPLIPKHHPFLKESLQHHI